MVKIANFRHGFKDGDLIAESCLAEIRQNGIAGLNELIPDAERIVIHLGTGWYRTQQTVEAYEQYLRQTGYGDRIANFYIPTYKRLGSEEMFTRMAADKNLVQIAEEKGWTYGIKHAYGYCYTRVRLGFIEAMQHILGHLKDGDLCVSIGHNGIIEVVGNHLNPNIVKEDLNLKELEGIVFSASTNTKRYLRNNIKIIQH